MHSTIFCILTGLMATFAMGSTSPIPGYAIETLQWEVEIAPGWTEVLNGTVQEVYSQILQIEPNFKLASTPRTHPAERESKIERRAINCGTWPLANKGRIQEGISYLNGLVGSPTNGPGPGACGRVSCSYNAAIWWCNDNTGSLTLGAWWWIADSAQNIIRACAPVANQVSGQNFEPGNWNTIVRGDSC